MRIKDLITESDEKFDIEEKQDGETIVVFATSRDEYQNMAGRITVKDMTIVGIDMDEKVKNWRDAESDLLTYVCKRQDEQNTPLAIVGDGIKTAMKRKLESYGFMTGEDNIMTRRPGAVLPIVKL